MFVFPGLQSAGSGGNRGPGSGDGGDGGGGGGGGSQQPLFDLAADDKEKSDEEVEDDETEEEVTKQQAPKADEAWKDLLTPSDQIEEAAPGQRSGTNRCTEIVIEGWPEVGALPKLVRGSYKADAGYRPPCTHHQHALSATDPCGSCWSMQKDLRDMLNIQEGYIFDYQDVVDDRRKLEM